MISKNPLHWFKLLIVTLCNMPNFSKHWQNLKKTKKEFKGQLKDGVSSHRKIKDTENKKDIFYDLMELISHWIVTHRIIIL